MGGSSSKQTSQQQSSTTTQLPEWVTSAGQQLFSQAQQQKPLAAYAGPMTAGPTQNQQAASATARANAGGWQGDMDRARAMTTAAAGAQPASVGADQVRASTMRAADQGVTMAAPSPQTTAATQGSQGYTAAGTNTGAPQVNANQVGGSTFDGAAASRYMNPYQQQVQGNTLRTMDERFAQDRATLDDGVQGARAFGGTRHALLEAEQERDQAISRTDYIDRSNADAFASAQGQFNTDRAANDSLAVGNADRSLSAGTTNASLLDQLMSRIDSANQFTAGAANTAAGANADRVQQTGEANAGRQQQVNLSNQDASNTAAGANASRRQEAGAFNATARNTVANDNADRNLDAGTTNAGLYNSMLDRLLAGGQQTAQIGEASTNLSTRDIANLSSTGAVDQGTEQAGYEAAYQDWLRAGNAPLENIKDIMAILSGAPRNVTTNGTSSGSQTTKQTPSLLNQLMGVAQIGASAFSDRRLKTDVSQIDSLSNGLGVYRYRYVWEGQGQPEHIGVMADEVARIMPEALGPVVMGFNTVDYSKLGGLLPC